MQIDSVSGEERQLVDYLTKTLGSLGLEVIEDQAGQKIGRETGNLIGRLPGIVSGEPLLFAAHLDTVEPGRKINPIIDGEVIRSDGRTILGADDKAGIAAILEMLSTIQEQQLPHAGVEVAFTIGEEVGLLGSKYLDYALLQAKMGYVLDSSGPVGHIIVRGPTQDRVVVKVFGRAAHAGLNPEEGVSAIQAAARALSKMRLGRIDIETTANFGVINGGKATNIVPDLVTLEGEARSLDLRKLQAQVRHMTETFETVALENGARAEVSADNLYPAYELVKEDRVVEMAVEALQRIGCQPALKSTGGGSDANILNGQGIVVANLGIGMEKVHTTEEYIATSNLILTARCLLEIVNVAITGE